VKQASTLVCPRPGRPFPPGVSGNSGGRPKGSKTFAIKALIAEALSDPKVWNEAIDRSRETLRGRKTVINGLEFSARVNREIWSGQRRRYARRRDDHLRVEHPASGAEVQDCLMPTEVTLRISSRWIGGRMRVIVRAVLGTAARFVRRVKQVWAWRGDPEVRRFVVARGSCWSGALSYSVEGRDASRGAVSGRR
jgi:hypothetical protein